MTDGLLFSPPLEAGLAEAWSRLRFDLEMRDTFWFVLVTGQSPEFLEGLYWKARDWCDQNGRTCVPYRPDPIIADQVAIDIAQLPHALSPDPDPGLTWVFLYDADHPTARAEVWERAAIHFFSAMNERRDVYRKRLHGGLVVAGPPALKHVLLIHAPDLFSIRSVVLEEPEPDIDTLAATLALTDGEAAPSAGIFEDEVADVGEDTLSMHAPAAPSGIPTRGTTARGDDTLAMPAPARSAGFVPGAPASSRPASQQDGVLLEQALVSARQAAPGPVEGAAGTSGAPSPDGDTAAPSRKTRAEPTKEGVITRAVRWALGGKKVTTKRPPGAERETQDKPEPRDNVPEAVPERPTDAAPSRGTRQPVFRGLPSQPVPRSGAPISRATPVRTKVRRLDKVPTRSITFGEQRLVLHPGVTVRREDAFVDRLEEQEALLNALQNPDMPGVLLLGLGGVGKSALAARTLHRLVANTGTLIASSSGRTDPDSILAEVARVLRASSLRDNDVGHAAFDQLGNLLRSASSPWEFRLKLLADNLPTSHRILLLLDNFEPNLSPTGSVQDQSLARFIVAWVTETARTSGRLTLFFTNRYPLHLPERAEARLLTVHLGSLSPAHANALTRQLPGIGGLNAGEKSHVLTTIGGHPRALEVLDALIRGQARFPDVEARLTRMRSAVGISSPAGPRPPEAALRDTLTLMEADADLGTLISRLDATPQARALLVGASVYRRPVDELGLVWQLDTQRRDQVPEPAEALPPPHEGVTNGVGSASSLPANPLFFRQAGTPAPRQGSPIAPSHPRGWEAAFQALLDTGLLSPSWRQGAPRRYIVHRWVGNLLKKQVAPEEIRAAHRRAARYWDWCAERGPRDEAMQKEARLEAHYHRVEAGEAGQP